MFPSHCKLLHNSFFLKKNFFGDFLCSMHDGTSIASDYVQLQLFFSIGVPNAFDVALSSQVNLVVVYRTSCCSTIEGDGLVDVEVVTHDLCVANVLLNLEPSPHTSPIEKLNKKKM
jgi:hypothetical protein